MIEESQPQVAFRDVPVRRIRVSWQNGGPVAEPDPQPVNTHDHEPTVIIWRTDKDVGSIEDITFQSPGGEFTQPVAVGSAGRRKVWVSIDLCSTEGDYKYSITAIHQDGGDPVTTDPMILNQDRA